MKEEVQVSFRGHSGWGGHYTICLYPFVWVIEMLSQLHGVLHGGTAPRIVLKNEMKKSGPW